ncbi:MAG: hypothetical protein ACLPYZ_01690 [Limisphaerales bacterium]
MNDNKLKHLEFIQNIITRMNANSFVIKGWSVTLVSALFALAADKANLKFVLIAYIPVLTFWALDGFFLSQEKQYRKLYEEVAAKKEDNIDFNLNASKFNTGDQSWFSSTFTKTLVPFHGALLSVVLLVTFGLVLRCALKVFCAS